MLQIKTIADASTTAFDAKVNEALADGWQLIARHHTSDGRFIAELEKEIITEAERCCENCAHYDQDPTKEPCALCEDGEIAPTGWEPAT